MLGKVGDLWDSCSCRFPLTRSSYHAEQVRELLKLTHVIVTVKLLPCQSVFTQKTAFL